MIAVKSCSANFCSFSYLKLVISVHRKFGPIEKCWIIPFIVNSRVLENMHCYCIHSAYKVAPLKYTLYEYISFVSSFKLYYFCSALCLALMLNYWKHNRNLCFQKYLHFFSFIFIGYNWKHRSFSWVEKDKTGLKNEVHFINIFQNTSLHT